MPTISRTIKLGLLFSTLIACGGSASDLESETLGRVSSAVQGGQRDTIIAHNFAVGIATREGSVCSGTLIAPNLVLTARHCVVPASEDNEVTCKSTFAPHVKPSTLFVSTEPSLRGAKKFYAAQQIITPDDVSFCGNDIALIQLDKNIPSSEAQPATPVVQFAMTDRSKIGGQITAMGYGLTSPNADDSGVRRIREKIDIVCVPGDDSYECASKFKKLIDSDKEFITEGYVCSGDSGGGAFDQVSMTSGKPYVLGALSRGPQTEEACLAAIYSRTDAHATMIVEAGRRAAEAGGYALPEWVTTDAIGEIVCQGDTCTATDATEPTSKATEAKTPEATAGGCAMSSSTRSTSSLSAFALLGVSLLIARRRRAS